MRIRRFVLLLFFIFSDLYVYAESAISDTAENTAVIPVPPDVQSFAETTELERLWHLAISTNGDVLSAQYTYESACLSFTTLDGAYAPSVTTSASSTVPDGYGWGTCPDSVSSSVSVTQPLPGGTSIGVTGTYALSAVAAADTRYVTQVPEVAFTLSQSLYPFYAQGKFHNPERLSLQQKKEYYYNQLLYVKQQKLETVTQYYILSLIYRKKMEIYETSIAYIEEQLDAINELRKSGGANMTKIAELESSRMSNEQDLADVRITYRQYVQYLKEACGMFSGEPEETGLPQNGIASTLALTGGVQDPCARELLLKIDILKTAAVLAKQSAAPVIALSLEPVWTLETEKASNWQSAWKYDSDSVCTWTAGVSLNMTPLISSLVSRTGESEEIEMRTAQDVYRAYLEQKEAVREQYEQLRESFEEQLSGAEKLCTDADSLGGDMKQQLDTGAVCQLDYDAVHVQVKIRHASLECIRLYVWLYSWLGKMAE
jgi:outer membrane protein TolC